MPGLEIADATVAPQPLVARIDVSDVDVSCVDMNDVAFDVDARMSRVLETSASVDGSAI